MDIGEGCESRATWVQQPKSEFGESRVRQNIIRNPHIRERLRAILSSTSFERLPAIEPLPCVPQLRSRLDESPLRQDLTYKPRIHEKDLKYEPPIREKLRSAILSSISFEKLPAIKPLPWVLHFNFKDPVDEDVAGQGIMHASLWGEPPNIGVQPCKLEHVCHTIHLMLELHHIPRRPQDNPGLPGVHHWLHEMEPRKGVSFGEALDVIIDKRLHHFTALTCTGNKQGEDLFIQILELFCARNVIEPAKNDQMKAIGDKRMETIYEDVRKSSVDSRRPKESSDQTSTAHTGVISKGLRRVQSQVTDYDPERSPDQTNKAHTDVAFDGPFS